MFHMYHHPQSSSTSSSDAAATKLPPDESTRRRGGAELLCESECFSGHQSAELVIIGDYFESMALHETATAEMLSSCWGCHSHRNILIESDKIVMA